MHRIRELKKQVAEVKISSDELEELEELQIDQDLIDVVSHKMSFLIKKYHLQSQKGMI